MGYRVIDIQPTPNPNAMKFVLDRTISEPPKSFLTPAQGATDPLASQLFEIKGVTSVLLLGDFVTVNKAPAVRWATINQKIRETLQKFGDGGR